VHPESDEVDMRSCDKRLEMRLPSVERNRLSQAAQERSITVSELMRRALRSYLGMVEPLSPEDAMAVAALRRRINAIETRIDQGGYAGAMGDLAKARLDAQALLGR
jgi:predicted DNA-binding protein